MDLGAIVCFIIDRLREVQTNNIQTRAWAAQSTLLVV
jgi:hypothetical protein